VNISSFGFAGQFLARLAVPFLAVIGALVVGIVVALFALPVGQVVSIVGADRNPGADFVIVAGSRLNQGRAVLVSTRGSDIVDWRWCPGDGLASYCIQTSGSSGFFDGTLALGTSGVTVKSMQFSRVDLGVVGGRQLPGDGYLGGTLANFFLPWSGQCLPRGFVSMAGDIMLESPTLGRHKLRIVGDAAGSVEVRGETVGGTLSLTDTMIRGTLQMPMGGNGGSSVGVDVSRRFQCDVTGEK